MKIGSHNHSNASMKLQQAGVSADDHITSFAKPLRFLAAILSVGVSSALSAVPFARQFSAGKPLLHTDPFSPKQVNLRSAEFYQHYGNDTRRGTLDNREARKWYLSQEAQIHSQLNQSAPLIQQAQEAFELRNKMRELARFLMEDRVKADRLTFEEPNFEWPQLVNKTHSKLAERSSANVTEEAVYSEIIESASRSRRSVNLALKLEGS